MSGEKSGRIAVLNLDTHLLANAADDRGLRPDEARLLATDFWCISEIVLWEIERLFIDGRLKFNLDHAPLARILREITIWPVTEQVARAIRRLDFRSDPADELIAATSIAHDIPLVTRDTRILASKVVPLALR